MKNKLIDINEVKINKYIESIRPDNLEVRKEIDFGYSYDGKVILLYEIRPIWNNPEKIQHAEFAKIRYYKSRQEWNLYWMRASGKWERYEPFPKATHLDEIIKVIEEDAYACFYG